MAVFQRRTRPPRKGARQPVEECGGGWVPYLGSFSGQRAWPASVLLAGPGQTWRVPSSPDLRPAQPATRSCLGPVLRRGELTGQCPGEKDGAHLCRPVVAQLIAQELMLCIRSGWCHDESARFRHQECPPKERSFRCRPGSIGFSNAVRGEHCLFQCRLLPRRSIAFRPFGSFSSLTVLSLSGCPGCHPAPFSRRAERGFGNSTLPPLTPDGVSLRVLPRR